MFKMKEFCVWRPNDSLSVNVCLETLSHPYNMCWPLCHVNVMSQTFHGPEQDFPKIGNGDPPSTLNKTPDIYIYLTSLRIGPSKNELNC